MKTALREVVHGQTHESLGWHVLVQCPGCALEKGWGGLHQMGVVTADGPAYGTAWEWDGNLESPTFSPSILVTSPPTPRRCHSYLRNGRWEFLADCSHPLAGQTVDMVDLPDWVTEDD